MLAVVASAEVPSNSATVRQNDATKGTESVDKNLPFSGTRFGDYELLEEIGRGGMGVVRKARQISLSRIVAVKLLPFSSATNPDYVKRFRAEASAAASLQHPNIVTIHEVGVHQGQHYFAMDLVEGPSLARLVAAGPLPAKRAARYARIAAEAIDYAHQRGLLHRDLKPSNILLDPFDQPRVTDFGLAKRLEGDSSLTLSGQVLGSPSYIPPEQGAGKHGRVDRRSDVYALGAMLYHLITGRAPFVAGTVAETLQQVQNEEPVPPQLLNPSVPRDLATICLKCLEKEPGKRYATAQALADDLGHFLNNELILARPVSRPEKVWRWCRRKPVVAGLSAAAAMSLLLGFAGMSWQWRRAELSADELRRNAYIADMNLAQQALRINNLGRARRLLDRHRSRSGQTDLRGWEWRYIWQQCQGGAEVRLGRLGDSVYKLSVSQDGTHLVAALLGGSVELRRFADGQTVAVLATNLARAAAAFSPTAPLLAYSAREGSVVGTNLWAVSGNRSLAEIAGSEEGRIAVTNLVTGTPRMLDTGAHLVSQLAFSPNGRRLAALLRMPSGKTRVIIWETEHWSGVQTNELDLNIYWYIGTICWSPNSEKLWAGGAGTKSLIELSLNSRAAPRRFESHPREKDGITSLAVSPSG